MNTNVDNVTYAKELQKLNAEFRRLKAYQEIDNNIVLFEQYTIEVDKWLDSCSHFTIKHLVKDSIIKAYAAFISNKESFVTPQIKKIPKTIRSFGNSRNHSIAKFSRFVEIQIGKKIPEFSLACRYYGIKPSFENFWQIRNMPEFVFEMEPSYFYYLAEHKELLGENKSATYKKVHAELDNKHVIKAFQTCKYLDGKTLASSYDNYIAERKEACQLLNGSPIFNVQLLNKFLYTLSLRDYKESVNHVMTSCAKQSKKHGQAKIAVNKLDEILDWLQMEHVTFDINQKKAGFKYLVRKSDEWHALILNEKSAKIKKEAWIPVIGELSSKYVKAKELTDSEALFQEGQTMRHCVGTYADYCKNYQSVIFHLEESKNIATAEFKIEDNKLKLAQIRGKYNAAIPTGSKLYRFTHEIIKEGNEALKTFTVANSLSNPF